MKRFVMLAALFAAACQPLPDDGGPAGVGQTSAEAASACAARGGEMLPQGRMQTLQCVISYTDAGQRCTDGDDCQGDCRVEDVANAPDAGAAAVGQCQAKSGRFGCYTTVEGGKAEATICVD
ncbi:MAG: hypothetical protein KKG14_03000 [Alphaproteobacteria bacterium]|nr:hypothetical protein [Alphaproteobacteria bacterium]MBU2271856.1 hypothetical protein [Alphaproteobacteria bacterium]MBU2417650.1 hypothetical protein [Alphaproteobacteria bacterium]